MTRPRDAARRGGGVASWREFADLPFAGTLAPADGAFSVGQAYDGTHFDHQALDDLDGSNTQFLECAFTGITLTGGSLRRSHWAETWLRDVRLVGTSLAETSWSDVAMVSVAASGSEMFGAVLRRVVLRGCKLDSVNLRDATLTDVTFDECLLRDVDFTGATLTRTSFPGSRLTGADFSRVRLDHVDLRGAELAITVDPGSLSGAIVSSVQLADLAPLLAESLGIIVRDG